MVNIVVHCEIEVVDNAVAKYHNYSLEYIFSHMSIDKAHLIIFPFPFLSVRPLAFLDTSWIPAATFFLPHDWSLQNVSNIYL